MPASTGGLIRSKLDQLGVDPDALAKNVKPLKGTGAFRLRVSDWRVIFTVEPDRIVVEDIGPRGSIYD
jgi:mRNA interferase RelE/StbE